MAIDADVVPMRNNASGASGGGSSSPKAKLRGEQFAEGEAAGGQGPP